ncbi:hypothetical protein VUR80DRAFT_7641 [Thermomyces stellatus]
MAPSTAQPSAVSSRLLSMKFMQRAVADTPPSSVESSSKRRKLAHTSSPADDPFSQANVQAAMQEVEAKRAAAVERRAAEMQEARWVIDAPAVGAVARGGKRPLNVVYVGYGDIDRAERDGDEEEEDNEGEDKVQSGRRITGNYKRKEEKESEPKSADDSDSEEGETSDSASDTPRRKKKSEAQDKRKREVKLNRLVSISGGGGQGGGGGSKSMKCYACGGEGHKAASSECPKRKRGKKRRAEG